LNPNPDFFIAGLNTTIYTYDLRIWSSQKIKQEEKEKKREKKKKEKESQRYTTLCSI